MKDIIYDLLPLGVVTFLMTNADARNEVEMWVKLICSLAITICTVGIQIYKLIRDRNNDIKK